jgi:hypothetical protein
MRKCEVLDKQNFEPKYRMVYDTLISIIANISASFAPPTNIGDTKIGAVTPSPPTRTICKKYSFSRLSCCSVQDSFVKVNEKYLIVS